MSHPYNASEQYLPYENETAPVNHFFASESKIYSSSRGLVLGAIATGMDGFRFGFGQRTTVVIARDSTLAEEGFAECVEQIYQANSQQPHVGNYTPSFLGKLILSPQELPTNIAIDFESIEIALRSLKSQE